MVEGVWLDSIKSVKIFDSISFLDSNWRASAQDEFKKRIGISPIRNEMMLSYNNSKLNLINRKFPRTPISQRSLNTSQQIALQFNFRLFIWVIYYCLIPFRSVLISHSVCHSRIFYFWNEISIKLNSIPFHSIPTKYKKYLFKAHKIEKILILCRYLEIRSFDSNKIYVCIFCLFLSIVLPSTCTNRNISKFISLLAYRSSLFELWAHLNISTLVRLLNKKRLHPSSFPARSTYDAEITPWRMQIISWGQSATSRQSAVPT